MISLISSEARLDRGNRAHEFLLIAGDPAWVVNWENSFPLQMSDKDLEQEKEAAAGSGNTTVVWKLASLPRLRQRPKKRENTTWIGVAFRVLTHKSTMLGRSKCIPDHTWLLGRCPRIL